MDPIIVIYYEDRFEVMHTNEDDVDFMGVLEVINVELPSKQRTLGDILYQRFNK